jgi:hypothetical protein
MSGYYFYNLFFGPNKFGWDLVAEELELGQTCPGPGDQTCLAIVSGIMSEIRICSDFLRTLVCG